MTNIEDLVTRLRADLGIPDDAKPALMDVLRRFRIAGIISAFEETPDAQMDGRDATWDPESRTILISSAMWQRLESEDDGEARFTVFHEIGHAVLGHPARNRMKDGKQQFGRLIDPDETEADDFALAFAIPRTFLGTIDIQSADALAMQFGLSRHMTDRRMIDLQKYARANGRYMNKTTTEDDSYADAMSQMRVNALSWNKI